MSEQRYKLVFYGQLAYGFEMEEVKTNLQQLCRFDRPRVEGLFSAGATTLKSGLEDAEARRYKAALDRTGGGNPHRADGGADGIPGRAED